MLLLNSVGSNRKVKFRRAVIPAVSGPANMLTFNNCRYRKIRDYGSGRPSAHASRHACGFALANKGHDTRSLQAYLGHKNIQHTVRYTELSPDRFKDFWR